VGDLWAEGALAGETIQSYGEKVLAAGAGLGTREPSDVVSSDMKIYRSGDFQFAVAQAEVSDLYEVSERLVPLTRALEDLREQKDWILPC